MPSKVLLFDGEDMSPYFGSWQESANARINAASVPRRHGALVQDAVVQDVRQVKITGTLLTPDDTAVGLRTVLRTLAELFSRKAKRLQLWDDRYVTAYKASFVFKYVEGSALRAADYQLNFTCVDPFWYYIDTNSVLTTFGTGDIAIDITAGIYKKAFTLTNNGTFVAYPAYTITANTGTITGVTLRNLTLGRQFTYDGVIHSGNPLVLDVTNFTVINGTEDLTNWAGDFVWLVPGANSMEIEATLSGTNDTILATWPDRSY